MPKEEHPAPGDRKSDPLKNNQAPDATEQLLGTADEEILELEDVEEIAEEEEEEAEEDIIDLTDVAGYEVEGEEGEKEEEILDLTEELEDVPDEEVMELDEIAEQSTQEEDILVSPPGEEGEPGESADEEDMLELDDAVDPDEDLGFEAEEDMFALDDEEPDAESIGMATTASDFTIEADTIELSEADRRSLEEEFSFEPEPTHEAEPENEAPQSLPEVEEVEPEAEKVWEEPDPRDDTVIESDEPERSAIEARSAEDTEEIVLDFGESPEEETASDAAFFGAFGEREQKETPQEESSPLTADSAWMDASGIEEIEPESEDESAEPLESVEPGFAEASSESIVGPSGQGRSEEIFAGEDSTGTGAFDEPAEITIEDDESEDEDSFAWPGEDLTATDAAAEFQKRDPVSTEAFEENALAPEEPPAYGAEEPREKTATTSAVDLDQPLPEDTDAPLSTEAMFGSDELADPETAADSAPHGEAPESIPQDGRMSGQFMHSDASEEQDMHRVADPISVRVQEPAETNADPASEDELLNRVFDGESQSISTERLEDIVEQTVHRIFAEKIETILAEAIERAVTQEITRLRQLVLGKTDTDPDAS